MLKSLFSNIDKDYRKYRWFFTSNNILVIGGKNDEQNELVINNFLKADYLVVHTSNPGSPFMILQSEHPSKKDIEEAAVFCACFSKEWKLGKKKIDIDIFKGKDIYKTKTMKTGTFGVDGEKKMITVKPELILVFQKGNLKAVPKINKNKDNSEILAEIKPGKMDKDKSAEILVKKIKNKYNYPVSKDDIMMTIPSDNLSVK